MIHRFEGRISDGSRVYRTAERYQPWSLVVFVAGEVVDLEPDPGGREVRLAADVSAGTPLVFDYFAAEDHAAVPHPPEPLS